MNIKELEAIVATAENAVEDAMEAYSRTYYSHEQGHEEIDNRRRTCREVEQAYYRAAMNLAAAEGHVEEANRLHKLIIS